MSAYHEELKRLEAQVRNPTDNFTNDPSATYTVNEYGILKIQTDWPGGGTVEISLDTQFSDDYIVSSACDDVAYQSDSFEACVIWAAECLGALTPDPH